MSPARLAISAALCSGNLPTLAEVKAACDEGTDYDRVHAGRYFLTLGAIHQLNIMPRSVLNVGGPSLLTDFLMDGWRQTVFSSTVGDLRLKWGVNPMPDPNGGLFDLVLCTEVIEHISDVPSDRIEDIDTFKMSGAKNLLERMKLCVSKTGYVVLTTPNSASWESIRRVLGLENAHQYEGHLHEYAHNELLRLVAPYYRVVRDETWNCYYHPDPRIIAMIREAGYNANNRGDTSLLILTR
jgi:hypothetical protein